MKKLFCFLLMLFCLVAKAQINVTANFNDFQFSPVTNEQLRIQAYSVPTATQASVVIGSALITNTGNGTVTNYLLNNVLYNYQVRDATFNTLIGQFWIFPTNSSGTITAQSCLVANGYTTFPAGSVAWAAATSDLRYAPISVTLSNQAFLFGTNTWTGTNIFTNNVIFSNGVTLGGVRLTSWPAGVSNTSITNINGVTNGLVNIQVVTNAGPTNPYVTVNGSNINVNLPFVTATTNGILSATDWNTFNGKQNALGFTPVPNTRNVSTSSPLTGGGALSSDLTLSIPAASATQNGYLSSADWSTFNGKAAGNGTLSTTSPLTGGGSLSNNLTVAIPVATSLAAGYLTNTDWVTFNNKQTALAVAAPISLTGSNLTISQSGTVTAGYLSSADWNTFNGKQAGAAALTNFAALGTNYYQATNANLTGFALYQTNSFALKTNGLAIGLTNSNSVVTGTWQAASGASSGFVWTSDSSGNATWQAASGGGGSGIGTNGGIGYSTLLTNPTIASGRAFSNLLISATNVAAYGANQGLILSNSTLAHNIPATNQPSPPIQFIGSSIVSGSPASDTLYVSNHSVGNDTAYAQLSVSDSTFGQILTADAVSGLIVTNNGAGNGAGITIGIGTLAVPQFSGFPNRVSYFDINGFLQSQATTDMLPQGSTNLWYSNSLVQAFSDIRYQRKGIKAVTTTYTVTTNDYDIIADTTSGSFALTLPNASFTTNIFVFKNIGANVLTVNTVGVDLIEGFAHFTNAINGESDIFQSDGANPGNWRHIATFVPTNSLNQTFIPTRNGLGTNTTLVNPQFVSTNGGSEPEFLASVAGANSLLLSQVDTNTGYAAAAFGWRHQADNGLTYTGAVGSSLSNSPFYATNYPFAPGFTFTEFIYAGGGWVNNNLPLAYIDTNLGQFHIATNGGTADVMFVNRQNGNGGIFGNWSEQSLTDTGDATIASNLTVSGLNTNMSNVVVGGRLTVTNSSSFSSNQAAISVTGHFTSNPGTNGTVGGTLLNGKFVAGAENNGVDATAYYSAVLVGLTNLIRGYQQSAIIGGTSNLIINTGNLSSNSVIVGGQFNTISNKDASAPGDGKQGSVILGGSNNLVAGAFSYALGILAQTTNTNTFVWNSSNGAFSSTSNGQFLVNATNGVGINTNNPGTNALNVLGGVQAYSFAGDGSQLTFNPLTSASLLTNTGAGFPQVVYQVPIFTNGIALGENSGVQSSNKIIFPNGEIVEKLHSGDVYEIAVSCAGGLALVEGQDAQSNSIIQIGASGAYHNPVMIQYDDGGLTNLAGWSHVFMFANHVNTTNRYFAMQLQAETTNAPYNNKLVFFDTWAGGNTAGGNTGYSGLQKDPLGSHQAGYFDSNNIVWGGSIFTNSVVIGSNIPVSVPNTFLEVFDNTDAGATTGMLRVSPDSVILGGASSTSGHNTIVRFRDRSGADTVVEDPSNNRFYTTLNAGFGGKTGPNFPVDVTGIINASSNIQAGIGAGYVTFNTNQFAVAATGWTNTNSFNCVLILTDGGITATYSDRTNTISTLSTFTGTVTLPMHPSYKVTAASGLSGVAIAQ